jgi:hypothetical protein
MSWQALRDLYADIEAPIALTRFAGEIMHEVIPEARISEEAKDDLCNSVRNTLNKHLEGLGYVLANYLVALMRKLPAADPYQHVDED